MDRFSKFEGSTGGGRFGSGLYENALSHRREGKNQEEKKPCDGYERRPCSSEWK